MEHNEQSLDAGMFTTVSSTLSQSPKADGKKSEANEIAIDDTYNACALLSKSGKVFAVEQEEMPAFTCTSEKLEKQVHCSDRSTVTLTSHSVGTPMDIAEEKEDEKLSATNRTITAIHQPVELVDIHVNSAERQGVKQVDERNATNSNVATHSQCVEPVDTTCVDCANGKLDKQVNATFTDRTIVTTLQSVGPVTTDVYSADENVHIPSYVIDSLERKIENSGVDFFSAVVETPLDIKKEKLDREVETTCSNEPKEKHESINGDFFLAPEKTMDCEEVSHDGQDYVMENINEKLDDITLGYQAKLEHDSTPAVPCNNTDPGSLSCSDSSSDSESSSSDSESSETSSAGDDLDDISREIEKSEEQAIVGPPRTKGELLIKDLPEVRDLDITLEDNVQLIELGQVFSVVECLVVVKALPKTPALDAESVLFLENRSCLGLVFETFGPVTTPYYSVRFNKETDITEKNILPGDKVFFAPDMLEYSHFVFMAQLKAMKGSDASWKNDEEPPPELIEYSDDEEEVKAKSTAKRERISKQCPDAGDGKIGSAAMEGSKSQPRQRQNRVVKRIWRGLGRGQQQSNQNPINQSISCSGPDPTHSAVNPVIRGPAPWTTAVYTEGAGPYMGRAERPVYPVGPLSQEIPPRFQPHDGFPRGPPVRGPTFMVSHPRYSPGMVPNSSQGHFPFPHLSPRPGVHRAPFGIQRPFMAGQAQWTPGLVCDPRHVVSVSQGFSPGYTVRGPTGGICYQPRMFIPPPPPPPPIPSPPPPPK